MNKRKNHLFCIILLAGLLLSACSTLKTTKNDSGIFMNNKYNQKQMYSITGDKIDKTDTEGTYDLETLGFGVKYTDTIRRLLDEGRLRVVTEEPYYIALYYIPESAEALLDFDVDNITVDELLAISQEFDDASFDFAGVFRKPANDDGVESAANAFTNWFSKGDVLWQKDEVSYYFGSNQDYSGLELSETDNANLETLVAELEEFRNGIYLFPSSIPVQTESGSYLGDFNVVNLDGEPITQDIFAENKITMVNVWATWCGVCAGEMPEFTKVYQQLPENTNFISICSDCDTQGDLGKQMMAESGGDYMVIVPDEALKQKLSTKIVGYPTTLLIGEKGQLINTIVGVPAQKNSSEAYLQILQENLDALK